MDIKFIGAAREVTGSKTLITTSEDKKILLDCGMFQGKGLETQELNRITGVEPKEVDYIILSHAHIDHSGLIPYFYRLGFRGTVITTHASRNLCSIMLMDSAHIQEYDNVWFNKKRAKKKLPPVKPLYTENDATKAQKLFIGVDYNRRFYIDNNISVKFTNAGHMLGSATINLRIIENGKTVTLAYTGDIGRPHSNILKSPSPFLQCDYLITESTYGDRLHSVTNETEDKLLKIIKDTCIKKKGKLIIPSFAIGRTQEIVFLLNKYYNAGKIPQIKVYVDSPLAVNATDIFRLHTDTLNEDVRQVMETDNDPFGFNSLRYIKKVDDSKAINDDHSPSIIISASGMLEAGRIKHHVSNNIQDSKNTILMVGYCAPSTLGARIQNPNIKEVSIFGKKHKIKAQIERIDALSGHGDYQEMMDYLSCLDTTKVKKTFLVHGEYQVQQAYRKKLNKIGFSDVEIPHSGDSFHLD